MTLPRGALCLVTDRRRLSREAAGEQHAQPVHAQIADAIAAGIDLVQIRERDLGGAALAAVVLEAVTRSRGTATRIIVNDRLDVALACGADGVHLRGDSFPPAVARGLTPSGFLIGRSVHDTGEAIAVAPACDYLIAGTVLATASKPGRDRWLGLDGLAAIARAVTVPVLAIGGITIDQVRSVAVAGAGGVAAIGLFASPAREGSRADAWRSLRETVRAQFDTPRPRS